MRGSWALRSPYHYSTLAQGGGVRSLFPPLESPELFALTDFANAYVEPFNFRPGAHM